jgi:hypothetical protein
MKKTGCIVTIAVIFVLLAGISANPAYAVGCKDHYIACCIDGKSKKMVADTHFTMCWSWKSAKCKPCHGGGNWSWFAKWCNENYAQCEGKCKGCWWDQDVDCLRGFRCYDKKGDYTCDWP